MSTGNHESSNQIRSFESCRHRPTVPRLTQNANEVSHVVPLSRLTSAALRHYHTSTLLHCCTLARATSTYWWCRYCLADRFGGCVASGRPIPEHLTKTMHYSIRHTNLVFFARGLERGVVAQACTTVNLFLDLLATLPNNLMRDVYQRCCTTCQGPRIYHVVARIDKPVRRIGRNASLTMLPLINLRDSSCAYHVVASCRASRGGTKA